MFFNVELRFSSEVVVIDAVLLFEEFPLSYGFFELLLLHGEHLDFLDDVAGGKVEVVKVELVAWVGHG